MSDGPAQGRNVVVLGGGIAGLAAAYFLTRTGRFDVTVLEQAPHVGGLCASFKRNGFVLDHGPHKMYSVIPGILDELRSLMGDRLVAVRKTHLIFLRGGYLAYPVRLGDLARRLGPFELARAGLGFAAAAAARVLDRRADRSYEDYVVRRFGRRLYDMVFAPLAEKVWGDPASLHADMARTRLPASNTIDLLLRTVKLRPEVATTNAEIFYYPRGGFGELPETMRERIEAAGGRVITSAAVQGIERADGRITAVRAATAEGPVRLPADTVVSSLPLPILGRLALTAPDAAFQQAVDGLQFRHLVLVYVEVRRPMALPAQWVFVPEREYVFSRVSEQKQLSPDVAPPDRTVVCCDLQPSEDEWRWTASDEEIAAACVNDLHRTGLVDRRDVIGTFVKRQRNFYPRYDLNYADRMQLVSDTLRRTPGLLTTGRIGMYNYNNSDHCADMGRFIAEGLDRGESTPEIWMALEERVRSYRIID